MVKKETTAGGLSKGDRLALKELYGASLSQMGETLTPEVLAQKEFMETGGSSEVSWTKKEATEYKYRNVLRDLEARGFVTTYKEKQKYNADRGRTEVVTQYAITPKGQRLAEQFEELPSGLARRVVPKLATVIASVFLLAGLGFMFASDISTTGNVVAEGSQLTLRNIPALLSVLLAGIGGFLFVKKK